MAEAQFRAERRGAVVVTGSQRGIADGGDDTSIPHIVADRPSGAIEQIGKLLFGLGDDFKSARLAGIRDYALADHV
jgi:hypothetical protein